MRPHRRAATPVPSGGRQRRPRLLAVALAALLATAAGCASVARWRGGGGTSPAPDPSLQPQVERFRAAAAARLPARVALHLAKAGVGGTEKPLALQEKHLADRRQGDAASLADKQLRAEGGLQAPHALGQGRLAAAQLDPGAAQVAEFGDGPKIAQIAKFEVHLINPGNTSRPRTAP